MRKDMNENCQPVFLIVGSSGERGIINHTIMELPSASAGDIVGKDIAARLNNGGAASDRAYFRVVSAPA
ncbi:hypothetical protein N825_37175 [Skermanella stibiiresistens SB22]|uniref:Uncharacterized protein n=1 Tax=Skermanella stibiiresistens SB22 TaxID=1385369 RepID=W9H9A6_9PROT|nr:hypothetical protein [Skermanella stibiiresistens]EWY40403.1 hypothetical protein N825_37175 [Skermanella stibiiresistens SB22]